MMLQTKAGACPLCLPQLFDGSRRECPQILFCAVHEDHSLAGYWLELELARQIFKGEVAAPPVPGERPLPIVPEAGGPSLEDCIRLVQLTTDLQIDLAVASQREQIRRQLFEVARHRMTFTEGAS